MGDKAGSHAKRIADKYITRDGKPAEPTEDSYEFGPEREAAPKAPDTAIVEAEVRSRVRAELDVQKRAADQQRLSRVARAMKKKHVAIGGWQTHPDILEAVTYWSSHMKAQRWMAAQLGKTVRGFEEALHKDKGENPLRLAFEQGRANAEQRHIDVCEGLDPTDSKQVVAWIFYMKAQYGWRDKPENATADAPKITFLLPGPMSEEEYYKKLGIDGPVDTRPVQDRTRQLGGVAVGDMRDVTPDASGKLPVLGAHKGLPENGGKTT